MKIHTKEPAEISIQVAGILLRFLRCSPFPDFYASKDHLLFNPRQEGMTTPASVIPIEAYHGKENFPKLQVDDNLLFDSGGLWKVFEDDNFYQYEFRTPPDNPTPYRILLVDKNFSRAQIFCLLESGNKISPITEYPVDELLVSQMLCIKNIGLEVHGLGVEFEGKGYLFVGESGAGKSTTARIWQTTSSAHLLSDDRIILRNESGKIRQYGTPWHGDAMVCSNSSSEVDKIFFLSHGAENSAQRLTPAESAARLFVRCFPPFWHERACKNVLDFIDLVVNSVPCYQLSFVPDPEVVNFVKNLP